MLADSSSFLASTSIPVCTLSAEGFSCQAVNPAFTRLLGWSAGEMQDRSFLEIIEEQEHASVLPVLRALARTGESMRFRARVRTRDSESRPLTWVGDRDGARLHLAAWSDDGHPSVTIASEYEQFFRLSLDLLAVASSQGYYLRVNPAFTEVLGWTQTEMLEKPFMAFVHPDDVEVTMASMRKLNAGASVTRFENRNLTKDGAYRWLLWSTVPSPGTGVYYATARDITHIKEYEASLQAAEAKVRETERLYRQILDAALDLILVKDEHSRILWANRAFCDYYGMRSDELHGIVDAPHNDPTYTRQYLEDDQKVWTTGKPLLVPEEPIVRHDGEVRYFDTVKAPVFDAAGKVLMAVGFCRDVTERRKAAAELHAAKEAAEQANRAKSVFLANMSHELRTPLNAILGYAQLMAKDEEFPQRYREAVSTLLTSGEHLLLLISDVLDIAKIEAAKIELHPSDIHLSDFLETIASLFEMRAQHKRLSFRCAIAPDLPAVIRCDETRLRQVLINLLSNAIKFTDRGSVSLQASFTDGKLRFEVQDTGVGIPQDQQQAIFQPFEQVGSSRRMIEGTGLGLAISSQLVRMMGGRIQVDSEPQRGSRFWFELEPEIVFQWVPASGQERAITGYEGRVRRLLICDDKPANRQMLRLFFEPLGFEILEAGDGEEAVAMAQRGKPDLIIMDLVMPCLDGFEATRRIRAQDELAGVCIFAASASVFELDRARSRAAGCDAFLAKPIDLDETLRLAGAHLGLVWRYREQPDARAQGQAMAGESSPDSGSRAPLSEDTLRRIYDAATIGDVLAITEILEAAGASAAEAGESSLAGRIWGLAKSFQNRKLKELIAPLIGRGEEPHGTDA